MEITIRISRGRYAVNFRGFECTYEYEGLQDPDVFKLLNYHGIHDKEISESLRVIATGLKEEVILESRKCEGNR